MVVLVRGLRSGMPFPGNQIFQEKSGKFLVPNIQEHPLPSTVSVPPFGTGHFPSRLSPENETGIPEFEIWYFYSRNSRNSELLRNFLLGTENSNITLVASVKCFTFSVQLLDILHAILHVI